MVMENKLFVHVAKRIAPREWDSVQVELEPRQAARLTRWLVENYGVTDRRNG
jgi:hypothetical protein